MHTNFFQTGKPYQTNDCNHSIVSIRLIELIITVLSNVADKFGSQAGEFCDCSVTRTIVRLQLASYFCHDLNARIMIANNPQ